MAKAKPAAIRGTTLKAAPRQGVDLGVLQHDFESTARTLKSAATKLANANDAFNTAKSGHQAAADKLRAAFPAVLNN